LNSNWTGSQEPYLGLWTLHLYDRTIIIVIIINDIIATAVFWTRKTLAPPHEDVLGEWGYRSTHSLTSVLDGVEWSASRTVRFTPRENLPVPIG
jgi:hypothetical protein